MGHGIDALYRFTVTWSLLGQFCENVFHFRAKETTPSDTLDEEVNYLINDTYDNLLTPMRDSMSNQCVLVQSVITTLYPAGGPFALHAWIGVNGAVADVPLPSYCAGVVSFHTGYSGRRTHGRTYVAGITKGAVDGNDLFPGAHATLKHFGDQAISRYGRDGSSTRVWGVVYSRKNGATRDPGPPPVIHYSPLSGIPWRTADARSTLYTQRHRLSGRGI